MQYTATVGYLTWILRGVTAFCSVPELVDSHKYWQNMIFVTILGRELLGSMFLRYLNLTTKVILLLPVR